MSSEHFGRLRLSLSIWLIGVEVSVAERTRPRPDDAQTATFLCQDEDEVRQKRGNWDWSMGLATEPGLVGKVLGPACETRRSGFAAADHSARSRLHGLEAVIGLPTSPCLMTFISSRRPGRRPAEPHFSSCITKANES
jgi:hypothetical protein